MAFLALVATELIASNAGLGYRIMESVGAGASTPARAAASGSGPPSSTSWRAAHTR
jgi:hypothetical protein